MLYYPVRKLIQRYTAKPLDFNYFSQTLLTEWKELYGSLEGLYFDPREVLYEPHDGQTISLGTREVADYAFPEHAFNKILYVEKKGLMPILKAARIGERYDMAIIAGEGYATEAARMLFERAEKGHYRLFVLHDRDPYGYNIARTLAEETRRMPGYSVEVTDLGLGIKEALSMGLQSEIFIRRQALPASLDLNETERQYFEGMPKGDKRWECQRVELNAFTAPALVEYLERKLTEAGATEKLIPPAQFLDRFSKNIYNKALGTWANRKAMELIHLDEAVTAVSRKFDSKVRIASPDQLKAAFVVDPVPSWRQIVENGIEKIVEFQDNLTDALEERLYQNATKMLKSRPDKKDS